MAPVDKPPFDELESGVLPAPGAVEFDLSLIKSSHPNERRHSLTRQLFPRDWTVRDFERKNGGGKINRAYTVDIEIAIDSEILELDVVSCVRVHPCLEKDFDLCSVCSLAAEKKVLTDVVVAEPPRRCVEGALFGGSPHWRINTDGICLMVIV